MSDDLTIPNPGYRGNRTGAYPTSAARRGGDADTRRLMMFAGGIGGVLALLIAASALTSRPSGQVPVVLADTSPIRVRPDNPGGMKVDAAENDIFSGGTDTTNARLAPAAETPDTRALRAAEAPPAEDAPPAAASVVPRTITPPSAAALMPPAPPAAVPAPVPLPTPLPQATAPERLAANRPVAVTPLVRVPGAPPAPLPSASATHVAAAPPVPALVQAKPLLATPTELHPADLRAAADGHGADGHTADGHTADSHAASGHRVVVQLAALGSDADAQAEWQRLARHFPELLGGHQPVISTTERDGHKFWRLRTGGFADLSQARSFCDQLRAKGGGCSVAEF